MQVHMNKNQVFGQKEGGKCPAWNQIHLEDDIKVGNEFVGVGRNQATFIPRKTIRVVNNMRVGPISSELFNLKIVRMSFL